MDIEVAKTLGMAIAVGFGVMGLLMTATPLAMEGCGFSFNRTTDVIQWHVLGMFLPSFFTGHLIAYFGLRRVMGAGVLLLIAAICVSVSGLTFGFCAVMTTAQSACTAIICAIHARYGAR